MITFLDEILSVMFFLTLIEGRITENYFHYVMMVGLTVYWILKKCKCILDFKKASKGMFVKEAKGYLICHTFLVILASLSVFRVSDEDGRICLPKI